MAIVSICKSCDSKLKVPDQAAGRRAQCPKCGTVYTIPAARAIAAAPAPPPRPAKAEERPLRRPAPAKAEPRPPRRPPPEAVPELEPEPVELEAVTEEPEPTETPDGETKPKKKKKKKLALQEESLAGPPSWVWWAGGLGVFFVIAAVGVVWAFQAGHGDKVIGRAIELAIMIPISMVILIISMLISNFIAGGIDFGEVHLAILKSFALLLVVNLIAMVPFGNLLALPVWLFGLMYLFNLDFWECRFLLFINWALNYLAKIFLMAIVLSAVLSRAPGGLPDDDQVPHKAPAGHKLPVQGRDMDWDQ
jgi:hypothetical protein